MAKQPAIQDAEAVARSLGGDRDAFNTLVRRYRALAVGVSFSICRDRALAEDVAQEAFIQAYKRLGQLARHASFCAWLMNIVKNAALRAAQNAARRDQIHRLASVDRGPHTENPTAAMEFAELLGRIDEDSQQVLTLRYVHGMSCAEVGSALGMPVGTVTSKISRALSTLRKIARKGNE